MKKLIPFALSLLLFSCAKEVAPEYTIISGKMINTEDSKFAIRGNSFQKEISVKEDGSFTDTLQIGYNGTYEIGRQNIYLHKGKNLSFDANFEKLNDITFTGDLAAENNYIAKKGKLQEEIIGSDAKTLFSLDETNYLAKIDELAKKRTKLLEGSTFTISDFKDKEAKNLNYHKEYLLKIYPDYHGVFAGNENFKVSENYPKTNEAIDFDNGADFDFSTPYRQLVLTHFDDETQKEAKKSGDFHDVMIAKIKALKNQNIKNALAETFSYEVSLSNQKMEPFYKGLLSISTDENFKKDLTEKYNKLKKLTKGNPSPKFNYENIKGGTTSLDDLKGKFVYIDVWATWCGPCMEELPFMIAIEKKYHDKNIAFVSISVDEKKDSEKWKKVVTQREMQGIQLHADNAFQSQFVTDYAIDGIPRFILIDPNGNIVAGDAPRPSEEQLIKLFTELGI